MPPQLLSQSASAVAVDSRAHRDTFLANHIEVYPSQSGCVMQPDADTQGRVCWLQHEVQAHLGELFSITTHNTNHQRRSCSCKSVIFNRRDEVREFKRGRAAAGCGLDQWKVTQPLLITVVFVPWTKRCVLHVVARPLPVSSAAVVFVIDSNNFLWATSAS